MKITQVDTDTLNKLLELSEALKKNDLSKRVIANYGDDKINKIINNLNEYVDNLLLSSTNNDKNPNFSINHFIDIISSYANHNFSEKLPVSKEGTVLDAITTGINMLGDELEHNVVSKKELTKERDWLKEVQLLAKVGSWEYDLKNDVLRGSEILYKIYELEEVVPENLKKAFFEKYHPDDLVSLLNQLEIASKEDKKFSYEHRIYNNAKSITYLAGICESIKDKKGKIIGIKGTVQDITKRKESEIELQRSYNTLNDQNKRLLNFSHIVSHNLRSHTSNLQSLLNLFNKAKTEEEKQIIYHHMKTASGLLDDTINHLQEIVSIQNNAHLSIEYVNLHDYVNKAIEILKDKIVSKNALVSNNISKNIPIKYNPAYLESILLNFLSNAIKYSHPKRQPVIDINYIQHKNGGILQFADNGLGIDLKTNADKLFGMYKIFHKNKDARGIGLFISKTQIEAMEGSVSVKSEVNKGTTFDIYIK